VRLAYGRGVRIDLGGRAVTRLGLTLATVNLVFTAGTAAFIHYWAARETYGPRGRAVIDLVLVQFHLATENVIAAWYSSMLLLSVAVAAVIAYALDRRQSHAGFQRVVETGWLVIAGCFALLSLDEIGSLHERIGMVTRGASAATGWVYVLAVPIGLIGVFMAAFAWLRVRRAPAAAAFFVAGIALFLSNPVMELIEMSLLHGGGSIGIHDTLLVVEEGLAELGGTLCFLLGVLLYIRATAGPGPHVVALDTPAAIQALAAGGLLLTAGVPATRWFVDRLPPGDTGIPDNWFASAALYLLALLALATRGRRAGLFAAGAIALSAAFGASLYGYAGWFHRIGYPGTALAAAVTAVASIAILRIARNR
jgi:hypothetical protein